MAKKKSPKDEKAYVVVIPFYDETIVRLVSSKGTSLIEKRYQHSDDAWTVAHGIAKEFKIRVR